jgi:hypothetical protein
MLALSDALSDALSALSASPLDSDSSTPYQLSFQQDKETSPGKNGGKTDNMNASIG